MQGWKTWAGVVGLVIGAVLAAMGMQDISQIVYGLSVPMIVVGLGHKLEKGLRLLAAGANSAADQLQKMPDVPVAIVPTGSASQGIGQANP